MLLKLLQQPLRMSTAIHTVVLQDCMFVAATPAEILLRNPYMTVLPYNCRLKPKNLSIELCA